MLFVKIIKHQTFGFRRRM